MILVYRGRSENQVTAVTLAIQKYAIIAYNDADTTWTERGRGKETTCEQEDLQKGPRQQAAHVQYQRLGPEYHHRDGRSGSIPAL